ncbi:MAG: NfeD family protein [Acidobacteriota bacterium]
MTWWAWLAAGLVLLVLELVTPSGFFIMFFGLGALTVGLLARFDLAGAAWLQWLIFTGASVGYLLLFRGRLQARFESTTASGVDTMVGELVMAREPIAPGATGRVELRGSQWTGRNTSGSAIGAGQRCRVVGVDGLEVSIQPE